QPFFFSASAYPRDRHSFPTRRSSDLRILSAEFVDRGIRVNTLSPGPTDTAMFGRFPGEEQGEAVKDVLRTNNPSKRMADPLEIRSEEHTSELQSRGHLVCRLLLEKKK